MKVQVMRRAWEIVKTLTGDFSAKLSLALKIAWFEIKKGKDNMKATTETREGCIERLELIVSKSQTYSYCELYSNVREWVNYCKNRSYFRIIEKSTNKKISKHYIEKDYGYFDNIKKEYIAGKNDLSRNFNFSGNKF